MNRKKINKKKNLLLRYRLIMNEFDKHNCTEIPISVIYRKYIYPKFLISKSTLYRIFNTSIDEELKAIEQVTH